MPVQLVFVTVSKRASRPQRASVTTGATWLPHAAGTASAQMTSVLLIRKQAWALFVFPGRPPAASRNICEDSSVKTTAFGSKRFNIVYVMVCVPGAKIAGAAPVVHRYANEYLVPGTNPKSVVSDASNSATANGSMPHASHSGALMPATEVASTVILRSFTIGMKLQNSSCVWPVMVMRTYLACALAAPPPVAFVAIAVAAVAKKAGSVTVLISVPVVRPMGSP